MQKRQRAGDDALAPRGVPHASRPRSSITSVNATAAASGKKSKAHLVSFSRPGRTDLIRKGAPLKTMLKAKNNFAAAHSTCAVELRSDRGPTVANIRPNAATPPVTIANNSVLPNWPGLTGSRLALSTSISLSVFTFLSPRQSVPPTPSNRDAPLPSPPTLTFHIEWPPH